MHEVLATRFLGSASSMGAQCDLFDYFVYVLFFDYAIFSDYVHYV
jgi:hypothetical protein